MEITKQDIEDFEKAIEKYSKIQDECERLMQAQFIEYISNCCSANVENGMCTDCKDGCEKIETQ